MKLSRLKQAGSDSLLFLLVSQALRERNWKAMDALTQYEKMAANALDSQTNCESKDNEIKSLKAEMAKLKRHNNVSA